MSVGAIIFVAALISLGVSLVTTGPTLKRKLGPRDENFTTETRWSYFLSNFVTHSIQNAISLTLIFKEEYGLFIVFAILSSVILTVFSTAYYMFLTAPEKPQQN